MMRLLLPAILGPIISILILQYIDIPYLWISLLWFGIFIYWTLTEKRQKLKPVLFNVGFLMLVFGILEAFFWITSNCTDIYFGGDPDTSYILTDDILGYAPDKGKTVFKEKYNGEDLIYSVTYTFNSDGLRVSPPKNNSDNECALFFGGSFTLGEGVSDTETLPYVVGKESGYDTYNFGLHGYGPHQMLAAIESGLAAERIEGCSPKYVIYQAILDHVPRSAGKVAWDEHGPEYILLPDGSVQHNGHFDDTPNPKNNIFVKTLKKQISKSTIYYRLFNTRVAANEQDIDLMAGIVAASEELLLDNYPDSSFHVIFWNIYPGDSNESLLISRLQDAGIEVHLVSDILPNYPENLEPYRIDDCDYHPNAQAFKETADYVVSSILGR